MFGTTTLSEIRRELRERLQGNAKVKSWLNRELKKCEANGEAVSEDLVWIQQYVEGEPIQSAIRKRTRPTAQGKKVMAELTQLVHDLEAELAKAKPTSTRRTQSVTAKKTRKRTTATAST